MKKKIANWGNYPVMESDEQLFSFDDQLQEMIRNSEGFIPRGNGRCYGDASLAEQTINTLRYDKILGFDAEHGIFECQSGLTLDRVLDVIVPKGWFLPVTPGTKFITIGGAVGSDVHGKNHHVDGTFGQHIIDMDIILGDGSLVTCSPEKYPDLFEATCGGMGLTGMITRVKFKLKRIPSSYIRQKQVKAANLEELIRLFEEYKHYTYSMAWIDCLQKGDSFGRGILTIGEFARPEELNEQQRKAPLALPRKKSITIPFNFPSWSLNTLTVKAFNFLYYAKNTKKEINNIVTYEPFFYPLDALLHWNRCYGKKGFVQYQFVLPLEAKEGLIDILRRIGAKGMGSFLVVLKVFGKQDSLISFPFEGFTLALDFPVRKGLFEFLDELDEVVLKYGGRLYMSKDARMNTAMLEAGYPRLDEFKAIVQKYNPDSKLRSLQSDRLQLTNQITKRN
ncbi:FAD-binding oxidoreductase [Pseudoflavitalea sp. G-6-1-2]|uniref:FAD-binding oxidoreductase n=1 Tax=Pseudoflavitalea sp. G-6-1-2 TaxID=2728841 RepID=UPI00146E5895|nr:FAD-binding oxidoreductase [Pseudoflavitalea sp. G-6-1-2]NML20737.1 FAD-binding oxidoreductase [Pseudoflavitalea sp. G-6-1-2]